MEEIVNYLKDRDFFDKIFHSGLRLSKSSKFFRYDNKIYELNGHPNFTKDLRYVYFVLVIDSEKIEKLSIKFDKEEMDNKNIYIDFLKEIQSYSISSFEDLLYSKINDIKNNDSIILNVNKKICNSLRDFHKHYQEEKERCRKNKKKERTIGFVYLENEKSLGFLGYKNDGLLNGSNIYYISCDIINKFSEKNSFCFPNLLEKYDKNVESENNYKNRVANVDKYKVCLFISNNNLKKSEEKVKDLQNANENVKKEYNLLEEYLKKTEKELEKLKKENKELKNKFNRFDIMEV